ncbi:hypothetical protein [Streptomyces sp. H27-H5]|uniref:hypothetical protein n=1 Tax=Streptomyces sp. H27-H5 TaxID=2996460 RepID=UPI00227069F1|nr:hypothetical protein [Streptomyces sp. H27-H5]MCY0961158.1 hypothetical protein [Streptomyces sp. H27-H5]
MKQPPPPVPPIASLSAAQVRGAACVHCGITLGPDAIDLGERQAGRAGETVAWYPRACRIPHP